MHLNGMGTTKNYDKAFYAYQNAIILDENNVAALYNLADMFLKGLGVPKSEERGKYYLKRAEEAQKHQLEEDLELQKEE